MLPQSFLEPDGDLTVLRGSDSCAKGDLARTFHPSFGLVARHSRKLSHQLMLPASAAVVTTSSS